MFFNKNKKKAKLKKKNKSKKINEKAKVNKKKVKSKGKVSTKAKVNKSNKKKKKSSKKTKPQIVRIPTNNKEKLVEMGLMRSHDFLSSTNSMMTKIHPMVVQSGTTYQVKKAPAYVSAILKLVLTTNETNQLSSKWSMILWNISQYADNLPDEATLTFVRGFERNDDDTMRKRFVRRGVTSLLSGSSDSNMKKRSVIQRHLFRLNHALDSGDAVVSFSAEVIVTAPDDEILEKAVNVIRDYMKMNDETRGLNYALDINKQMRPLVLFGPNSHAGNDGLFYDMTSLEAGYTSLFVDSGGDRSKGSEYVGISIGKYIRSRAAYNFVNRRSLFVGNDTLNQTTTLGGGEYSLPSQLYLSHIASRAYLLTGKSVTHFVADHDYSVAYLNDFPIYDRRKVSVDVSKGLLNIIEPILSRDTVDFDSRMLSHFPTHIDNIIMLLSQFRDVDNVSVTDDFANATREVLTNFLVVNKYWSHDARFNLDDVRLFIKHEQYKQLSDFGLYVSQERKANAYPHLKHALDELDIIINKNIIPTIPALDTKTNYVIDELFGAPYRVVDLTGMAVGAINKTNNPSMNIMMLSYLNVILPSLKNGDVIFFHGISRLSGIADTVMSIIESSGVNLDVVFTESNQQAASRLIDRKLVERFDFTMVDLYKNRVNLLESSLGIQEDYMRTLSDNHGAYYVLNNDIADYIYIDYVL